MPVIILQETLTIKLKLFISQLENADISWSPYLVEQIECGADNGNLRKYTIKIELLHDSFESRFCDFAKEDQILAFINPFSLSERKIMKIPSST